MAAIISNLQSFKETLRYHNAVAERRATQMYRDLVSTILEDIAAHTPQWTGTLAASWQVVVGKGAKPKPNYMVTDLIDGHWSKVENPSWIGDREAVEFALEENAKAIATIRWNSHVAIVNTHPGLQGEIQGYDLREGNYVTRSDFMAVTYIATKYSHKHGRGLQIVPSF